VTNVQRAVTERRQMEAGARAIDPKKAKFDPKLLIPDFSVS
jgi:hypothetical protein